MRALVKRIAFLTGALIALPGILLFWLLGTVMRDRDSTLEMLSQFFSMFPGKPGNYIRAAFYHYTLPSCAIDATISFNTLLFQADTHIGSGVYIGPQGNIGKCTIGDNTLLGSAVHVMSGKNQHRFDDLTVPIKDQGGTYEQIHIGHDCWIGNGSLIMANIGNQCIIGAGSVVTEDLPDRVIAAGNPAKIIKRR